MSTVKNDFVKTAITALSEERFSELVTIFQNKYWNNTEIISVDGKNDGGCDIKIFQNKKEQKKCVQITVQKSLDSKIERDLLKASKLVDKYKYLPVLEFYCSIKVSNLKYEEYMKRARMKYGIELDLYDASRIADLGGNYVSDFIYSLHSDIVPKPGDFKIEKSTKYLYDLLSNGNDSSNIKNSLIESLIISIIYEKETISSDDLKKELSKRLGKNIPDITPLINSLKTDQRIIKDEHKKNFVRLTDDEIQVVKDIYASSLRLEKDFHQDFQNICIKHHVSEAAKVIDELKNLFSSSYSKSFTGYDEEEGVSQYTFNTFKSNISCFLDNTSDVDAFVRDIKELCDSNNYINKVVASESFVNLYKSNQLEQYLNRKEKVIYLDTPSFIYYICSIYGDDMAGNDWDDPFYRSMKSLKALQRANANRIKFCVMADYLKEVSNEIKKAIQISKLEACPFFNELGATRNTLFNYYIYLKRNDLFEVNDDISCFNDFLEFLGFDDTDVSKSSFFCNTERTLHSLAEEFQISVVSKPFDDLFIDASHFYVEKLLELKKEKSSPAINNDVSQVISALSTDKINDCYVATWDTTLSHVRNYLIEKDVENRFSYFYIINPARLSNRLALESFNINASALTNDIFAYADTKYDIFKKVKSLLEMVAPYMGEGKINDRLLRKLANLRKKQCEAMNVTEENKLDEETNLPVEEALLLLIPKNDATRDSKILVDKFSSFMNNDDNTDYIIGILVEMMKLRNYAQYDLSDFWGKVNGVAL